METARREHRFRNLLTGEIITAYQTTEHACSSYGQPVWVNVENNEAFDLIGLEEVEEEYCEEHETQHAGVRVFCRTCGTCRGDQYSGDAKNNPDDDECLDCREAKN